MDVYYCLIDDFQDLTGSELLTPARRNRMLRYFQPEDQKRCLVAGLLLRAALGIDEALYVEADPNGKPFLPGGPFFNLTHAGDMVAMAVADCEVGIDAEDMRPYSDEVATRCFTPAELAWMRAQPDLEQAFYVLWTGKESVMKATGQGFRLEPDSFTILPIRRGLHQIAGGRWYLQWRRLHEHILCVACARPEPIQWQRVEMSTLLESSGHILSPQVRRGAF